MTTQYIYDLVDTWNDGATTFTSIKMDVTDTASNAASLLMDLQVGTVSKFSVSKAGLVLTPATSNTVGYAIGLTNTGFSAGGGGGGIDTFLNGSRVFRQSASSFRLGASVQVGWSSSADVSVAGEDTILTRRGIANLRLGAADTTATTAPTPQFLSAQSWASSTTNDQLGANFTIDGSQGTGTGAGGSIIFRVAPAGGTSNGVQNGLSAALTIASDRTTTFAANVYFTNTSAGFTFSNSATFSAVANGATLANFDGGGSQCVNFGSTGIGFGATTGYNSADVRLLRDAANTLALRNSTAAQTFRVYNTTDGTNSEYGFMKWNGTTFEIGAEKSGTGSNRSVIVRSNSGVLTLTDGNSNFQLTSGQVSLGTRSIYQLINIEGQSGFSEMTEMTAPAAPAANSVRIYAVDNGSGKTQLMALFATGVAQQIAIQP